MATTLLYARPDEIKTYPLPADDGSLTLGSVSSANVDTAGSYSANSLIGGWPGTPTRWTVANPSGTVTLPAAGNIDLVVVSHHKLSAGALVTFASGIVGVVTVPTIPPDGIRLNAFKAITPVVGATGFTFTVSGNTPNAIIGEILAGPARTLTLPTYQSDQRGMANFTREMQIEQSSIAPYDPALSGRAPWKGKYVLTASQLDDVKNWFLSQRNGTRPSVIIPDATVNDAWVGFLQEPQWAVAGPFHFHVDLVFTEIPRSRW